MIPSRHNNPFATCWTRPGVISFRFAGDQSAAGLVAKLAEREWWGEIVGPHGSGKTTLLATLTPLLEAAGRPVYVVDGYEQLGHIARWRLRRRCRREKAGLLVTSHAPTGLPTLTRLAPDRVLVDKLVGQLCEGVATPITAEDVAASHARRGSNVREILFDLYDRHQRLSRPARTAACGVA